MPKLNSLRPLTTEERATMERLAHARTEAMRRGERARIILALAEGETACVVAPPGHVCEASVHYRRKRFNEAGFAGREAWPRSGRPETCAETPRGQLALAAQPHPQPLGMSVGHGTLARGRDDVNPPLQRAISRSPLAGGLKHEGLQWYQERPD